jgi:hypothetical protein
MKRTSALTVSLVLLLVSLVFGVQFVKFAEANPIEIPGIWIASPSQTGFSEFEGNVPLNVELHLASSSDVLDSTVISYSVDGAANVSLTNLDQSSVWEHPAGPSLIIIGKADLTGLSEGNHTVVVYGKTPENVVLSDAFSFNVKASPSPTPIPHGVPEPTELEVILGVAVTVAVITAGLGLLVYLIKRK